MKYINNIMAAGAFALAISGVALTSCSDFLTEEPNGRLVTEGFFSNNDDLILSVNALYMNVAQAQSNSNPYIMDCQGDDMTSTTGSNKGAYLSADAFETPTDYKGVEQVWKWQYNIIQAANLIIDNAGKANATTQQINIAKGNAYFWRACAYFRLVRLFGPLPINEHNAPDNNSTPLSSVEDVYKLIESDLLNADACDLPARYNTVEPYKTKNLGSFGETNLWITKQAVKSLMAAVYMNMAGYPMNKTEYYEKAADAALDVYNGVKNGTYPERLESDYKQVFSYGNNFSQEQIVTISYYDVPGQMGNMGSYVSQFPLCHRFAQFNGGWGDFVAERHYWAEYPEGPRKAVMYDPLLNLNIRDDNGEYLCVSWWATKDEQPLTEDGKNAYVGVYHPMFSTFSVNADATGNAIAEPYDYSKPQVTYMSMPYCHRFIRLSEVYCWLAESAARSGKHVSEGTAALGEVMARAYDNVPTVTDLAEQAYKEHGYEVAGYPLALVSRRSDEFRMNRFEQAWQYRNGSQDAVIVPRGTVTHSYKEEKYFEEGNPRPKYRKVAYTYELSYDLVMKENNPVATSWNGENSIYHPYPPTETEKNPNIKR